MQVRAHLANLEKGQKQVCLVFEEWTSSLNPGPVSPWPVCLCVWDKVLSITVRSFVSLIDTRVILSLMTALMATCAFDCCMCLVG